MIVRIHKVGSSFKGCAAYLLHDKDASSAERVGWVETHNLGTDNPQTAWRVMAATAMKQAELKKAAGLRATGNKAKGTVLHFSLSWEQDASLTKEEMIEAARSSLSVIGVDPATSNAKKKAARRQFADEHQAMIVCHTDEKHPHVHVMVNRVHPEHGAILPSSNDRVKLSDWALDYERANGGVICEAREQNQAMRKRDLYVKGEGNLPRHSWEMSKEALGNAANDNASPALLRLKAAQKAENDVLARDGGAQAARHRNAWKDLSEAHSARMSTLRDTRRKAISQAKAASVSEYLPKFRTLKARHEREQQEFKSDERDLVSGAGNVWKSMKLLARIRGENADDLSFKDYWAPFAGAGARFDLVLKRQFQEKRALELEQDDKLAAAKAKAIDTETTGKKAATTRYTRDKADLVFVHDMEDAALKTRWKTRNEDQRGVYAEFAAKEKDRTALLDTYAENALAAWDDHDLTPQRSGQDKDDDHSR